MMEASTAGSSHAKGTEATPVIPGLEQSTISALQKLVKRSAHIDPGPSSSGGERQQLLNPRLFSTEPPRLPGTKANPFDSDGDGGKKTLAQIPEGARAPILAENLRKFDIFDAVDEERLTEFEEHFETSRRSSNYDAFKRVLDPAQFATVNVVSKKDGQSHIS
mmetsp:Transcript_30609/g.66717  ORF Transcript_30609/g.66717 Transcript_30609/m.66717 type:complete len:163 (+) Transcript_30609:61-549(+)